MEVVLMTSPSKEMRTRIYTIFQIAHIIIKQKQNFASQMLNLLRRLVSTSPFSVPKIIAKDTKKPLTGSRSLGIL